jgi:hypothetical protein
MNSISQSVFQFGIFLPERPNPDNARFSKSCDVGDWHTYTVDFPAAFPAQVSDLDLRVIVTANNRNRATFPGEHNVAPVAVVHDVKRSGFTLAARNSDCTSGFAAFDWMAVAETPSGSNNLPVDLRIGVVQPSWFHETCKAFDTEAWRLSFGPRRRIGSTNRPPVFLVTGNNLNIQGATYNWANVDGRTFSQGDLPYHNSAVVGVVQDPSPTGFGLKGRNSDISSGQCAFYYLALSDLDPSLPSPAARSMWVDSGRVGAKGFAPSNQDRDWQGWEIYFQDPFLTPPIVLVTASDLMDDGTPVQGGNPATVGLARNVTTDGFNLDARNSDCGGGWSGFYWVAIGCAKGCDW